MNNQTRLGSNRFNRPTGWYKYFGLYDQENKAPIPLKQIIVDAKINEYIAEIAYSQLYYNNQDVKLETVYFFPISNTGCFHDFKAKIGTKILEGVIKKKKDARQDYEKSTANNEFAIYAETLEKDSNIMCVKIGNLPPKVEIEITLSYIERVEISMNKFWSFSLSSTFLPRSMWSINDERGVLENYAQTDLSLINEEDIYSLIGFKWDVNILINSKRPFDLLESPSHLIDVVKTSLSGCFSAKVSLSADKTCLPDKDFILNYTTDSINTPNCMIGPFEKGYCALISFCPDTTYLRYNDAYMAYLEGRSPFEQILNEAKQEFYLVVDRSEYMNIEKINLANEILCEFLKQLPKQSYFNVLNFGEDVQAFEQQSVIADPSNITKALNFTTETATSLTKHKISALFDYFTTTKLIPEYPRTIIILTNGKIDVGTPDALRMMNDKLPKARIFTVGVGNGSRTDFVMQTALQGYGTYNFIRTQTEISQKVSHILQTSVAPYFTDFELDIGTKDIHSCIIPAPKSMGYVMPNELVEFVVIFNQKFSTEKSTKFTLKFKNDLLQKNEEYEGQINLADMDPSRSVVMLGIQKLCNSKLEEMEIAKTTDSDITRAMAENLQATIENNSIHHGILTPHTAFICIDKDVKNEINNEIVTQKFIITGQQVKKERETTESQIKMQDDEDIFGSALNMQALSSQSSQIKLKITSSVGRIEKHKGAGKVTDQKQANNDQDSNTKMRENAALIDDISGELMEMKASLPKNISRNSSKIHDYPAESGSVFKKDTFKIIYRTDGNLPANSGNIVDINTLQRPNDDSAIDNSNVSSNVKAPSWWRTGSITMHNSNKKNKKSSNERVKPSSLGESEDLTKKYSRDLKEPEKSKTSKIWYYLKALFSCRMMNRSSPKRSSFDFKIKALPTVIQLQQKEGCWNPNEKLLKTLNYKIVELMKPIPQPLQAVESKEEIWLTLLMLAWIDHVKETPDQQDACNKAFAWLKQRDTNYLEHLEKARLAIG